MPLGNALLLALALSGAAPVPQTRQPNVDAILKEIKSKDTGQLAVSEEDGQFLRMLVAASRAKHVLEIGGASGYSAIWMAQAVRANGGRLVTIEYDKTRAREAQENIRRAGYSDIVQVVSGDAFVEIPKLTGTFDFVFLDAWKKDYQRFFDLVFPRLDRGGLFCAHNVVNKASEMGDFLKTIHTSPALWTSIVTPAGEGISISYRRQ